MMELDNVVVMPQRQAPTYTAKAFFWTSHSLLAQASGTLDGFIDLALFDGAGVHTKTHIITCDEARLLASRLLAAADDVQANCLFDGDALLIKETTA